MVVFDKEYKSSSFGGLTKRGVLRCLTGSSFGWTLGIKSPYFEPLFDRSGDVPEATYLTQGFGEDSLTGAAPFGERGNGMTFLNGSKRGFCKSDKSEMLAVISVDFSFSLFFLSSKKAGAVERFDADDNDDEERENWIFFFSISK